MFAPFATVQTPDGAVLLPNALASVDHPFHIARAELLRQSLAVGDLPRWVANHQGGYPVEFYPFGVAWVEVAVWAALLGTLPMPAVHTIVVTLLFLLPIGAFWLLARQDGWTFRLAVIASVLHVAIPGDWWHGGYTELVQWGLITNVAGAVATLYVLPLLSRFLASGERWAGAAAILVAVFAVYCNPRSIIGLAVVGAAVWFLALLDRRADSPRGAVVTVRLMIVGCGAALLAAPQLSSLWRYRDQYAFVRYERYADPGAFAVSAMTAVSLPVLILGLAGVVWAFAERSQPGTRGAALALVGYAGLTLLVTALPAAIPQLEATRLMPLQRLLTMYLAAIVIERLATRVADRLPKPRWQLVVDAWLVAGVVIFGVMRLASAGASAPPPAATDPLTPALYAVTRAAVPQQAALERAVRAVDAAAPAGTALLVVGSGLSWHQQLWAPLWTDRPLMYDDWLWGWNREQIGTSGYRWEAGNFYPDPAATLSDEYLARYGIGGVVVTGPVAADAARSSRLQPLVSGDYAGYVVRDSTLLVTVDGSATATLAVTSQTIHATAEPPAAEFTVRQSWFPRWQGVTDGKLALTAADDDSQIEVTSDDASSELTLTYGTTGADWGARGAAVLGATIVLFLVGGKRFKRWR